MPAHNSAAAAARTSPIRGGTVMLLMAVVFLMSFGASLIQKPTESFVRKAICLSHYGVPVTDGYCHAEAVEKQFQWHKMVMQVCQAAGGLLVAYPVGIAADTKGRRMPLLLGAFLWLAFPGILIASLGKPGTDTWVTSFFLGAGRTAVEITVFAIANDASDDSTRSTHFANVVSCALLGFMCSHFIPSVKSEVDAVIAVVVGVFFVAAGALLVCVSRETLLAQREQYRDTVDPLPGTRSHSPLSLTLSSLLSPRTALLLAVVGTTAPLATASIISLERYFPVVVGIAHTSNGSGFFLTPLQYLCSLPAVAAINCVVLIRTSCCRRASGQRSARFDYIILFASACSLVLGAVLLLSHGEGAAIAGLIFAGLGAAILAQSCALLLYGVGAVVRARFAGRVFAVIAVAQCAVTMVLVPVNGLATQSAAGNRLPLKVLFSVSLMVALAVYGARTVLEAPAYVVPASQVEEDGGFELVDLEGPRMPPPAYPGNQRDLVVSV